MERKFIEVIYKEYPEQTDQGLAWVVIYKRVTIYYLTAKPSINDYTIYRGFIFSYILLLNKDSHCKAIYNYLLLFSILHRINNEIKSLFCQWNQIL